MADHLAAVGLVIGTVTTTANSASTSAIQYPGSLLDEAHVLGTALAQSPLLAPADVPQITIILGAADPSGLLSSLRAFAGLPCAR